MGEVISLRGGRGVCVDLGEGEIRECCRLASIRQSNAEACRLRGHNGAPAVGGGAFELHLHGLLCEMAAFLVLRPRYWNRVDRVGGADFEDWIDVKGRSLGWHDLPVQRDDDPRWAYVLVTSEGHPRYRVVGWAKGWAAKTERNWRDPAGGRPAYFMRQDELWPLAELQELMRFWEGLEGRG